MKGFEIIFFKMMRSRKLSLFLKAFLNAFMSIYEALYADYLAGLMCVVIPPLKPHRRIDDILLHVVSLTKY